MHIFNNTFFLSFQIRIDIYTAMLVGMDDIPKHRHGLKTAPNFLVPCLCLHARYSCYDDLDHIFQILSSPHDCGFVLHCYGNGGSSAGVSGPYHGFTEPTLSLCNLHGNSVADLYGHTIALMAEF